MLLYEVSCWVAQVFHDTVITEDALPVALTDLIFNLLTPIYEFHSGFLRDIEQRLAIWYLQRTLEYYVKCFTDTHHISLCCISYVLFFHICFNKIFYLFWYGILNFLVYIIYIFGYVVYIFWGIVYIFGLMFISFGVLII